MSAAGSSPLDEQRAGGDDAIAVYFYAVRHDGPQLVSDKGFGFILAGDGFEYFFHNSACQQTAFDDLREGQAVTFDVGQGPKGRGARRSGFPAGASARSHGSAWPDWAGKTRHASLLENVTAEIPTKCVKLSRPAERGQQSAATSGAEPLLHARRLEAELR